MAYLGRFRKANVENNDSTALLKSSPNILENFAYEDFKLANLQNDYVDSHHNRCNGHNTMSPIQSLEQQHIFMNNGIVSKFGVNDKRRYSSPSEKEVSVRRSLEEISKDLREIEDFLAATENVMRREKERDERITHLKRKRTQRSSPNKENKTPSPIKSKSITYKINSFKNNRRTKPNSPRFHYSRLYFRNGRIGCVEAEKQANNVESTHALVKNILRFANEKPLVSPDSVRRVLSASSETSSSQNEQIISNFNLEMTPLPGAVEENVKDSLGSRNAEGFNRKNIESFELKPIPTSSSQPVIEDEDEKDVEICYKELPEVQNDEQNLRTSTPTTMNEVMDSEVAAVDEMPVNYSINRLSSAGSLDSDGQQFLRDQVRHLVRRFTARANKMKKSLEMPPTPSSSGSSSSSPPPASAALSTELSRNDKVKLVPAKSPNRKALFVADTPRSNVWICSTLCGSNNDERTLDPQGKIYIFWLCVVSLSFLYNAWVIPLRSAFPFQTKENTNTWLLCDFCADAIYLLDVVFFKHRVMYLFEGFWVKNKTLTRKNYMRKLQFKLDLLALLPLELLYFKLGTNAVYLRFPRFFKIQSFWEVFRLLDRVISSPHIVRVGRTLTYMLYMIHITATLYYAYSKYQGLGVNRWVFSGKGHPYVRCFAFATKTATSIGKNPKPEREGEYVFMTVAWLMGVFVFALLIGQIRDIISTATRNKNEYRLLEDETLEYMRRLNLSQDVQKRVKMWFKFTWEQQRTLDEANILDSLPINLKTDICISVHIQTLSKVQLFADCEEALLRDLVLKLRAVTFLPGDFVCRKGEVGREMYIVKLGQVQVMGGPNSDVVLATLTEGSVFGEISLLGINGADRRTADVRSKGYSNLFVLSKSDLNEVIAYYPQAQNILKKRARALIRKNAAREREERAKNDIKADVVIGNPKTPESAPKLLQTVIQALPYESPAVMLITRGSKKLRKKNRALQMDTILDKELDERTNNDSKNPVQSDLKDSSMGRYSPDLLSSIQTELKSKNKFINLTDSEKALIITTSNNSMEPISEDEIK